MDVLDAQFNEDSESEEKEKITTIKSEIISDSDSSHDLSKINTIKKESVSSFSDEDDVENEEKESLVQKKEKKVLERTKRNLSNEVESGESQIKRKQLRKRQKVKYYQNSSSSSSEESDIDEYEEEDEEDYFKVKKRKKNVKSSSKKAENSCKEIEIELETEYHKMLDENRFKNLEMLKSLGIDTVKNDFYSVMKKPYENVRLTNWLTEPAIRRESERQKINPDYINKQKSKLMPFQEILLKKNSYENFVKDFSDVVEPKDSVVNTPIVYDKNIIEQLSQSFTTRNRYDFCGLTWHPSVENSVLAFCNRDGNLSLLKIKESDCKWHSFSVHSAKVTNLQFNPSNSFHLFSSSRDGRLLCCDIQKQVFTEILSVVRNGITYFDFLSPSSVLLSLTNGKVNIADIRSCNAKYEKSTHTCHYKAVVHTVNVHPVDKNYFVTAGTKTVRVWDLRNLSKLPVAESTNFNKTVQSALYSPVSGDFLLASSSDNCVRIFDCTRMTTNIMKCYSSFTFHNVKNVTKPVWLPNSDDIFSLNVNGDSSEEFAIYDKDLKSYATIKDGIKDYRTFHAFHPFKNVLASGTSDFVYLST